MSAEHVAVLALAAWRVTRLVTADRMTEPLREPIRRHATKSLPVPIFAWERRRQARWLALFDFLTCPWCISMWVATALYALATVWPGDWTTGLLTILAVAAVAGWATDRTN